MDIFVECQKYTFEKKWKDFFDLLYNEDFEEATKVCGKKTSIKDKILTIGKKKVNLSEYLKDKKGPPKLCFEIIKICEEKEKRVWGDLQKPEKTKLVTDYIYETTKDMPLQAKMKLSKLIFDHYSSKDISDSDIVFDGYKITKIQGIDLKTVTIDFKEEITDNPVESWNIKSKNTNIYSYF